MKLLLDSDVWTLVGFALITWCLYRIQPEVAGIFVGAVLFVGGVYRELRGKSKGGN